MKKINVLILGLLVGAGVYSQPVNDPNIEVREVKGFSAIRVSGAFDVYLTQGDEEKVAVSASDKKFLENIKTEVKDGVLQIGWEHGKKWNIGNKKLRAYISFKEIKKLSADGASDIKIIGALKAGDLEINLSGASDLLDGRLEAKNLSFAISGASDVKISGSAEKLDIDASGASSFKGFNFSADYCNAKASGASDISITVNKELSANATGASDIGYKGSAIVNVVKTTGASSISHKS
ncbi:MAG: head GIN domain-containing protein [Bacteroidota bacterium]|nr:head GIN domain-containing protein [Bacteroidota bacterium]